MIASFNGDADQRLKLKNQFLFILKRCEAAPIFLVCYFILTKSDIRYTFNHDSLDSNGCDSTVRRGRGRRNLAKQRCSNDQVLPSVSLVPCAKFDTNHVIFRMHPNLQLQQVSEEGAEAGEVEEEDQSYRFLRPLL